MTAEGTPIQQELITFEPLGESIYTQDGDLVFKGEIRTRTDSSGMFSVSLMQSSSIDTDKSTLYFCKFGYRMRIPVLNIERYVSIPDQTGINWSDLAEDLDQTTT